MPNKVAFTNDVIILEGLEMMTEDDWGRGCQAKDDVTFLLWFLGKIKNNLIQKSWFYYK